MDIKEFFCNGPDVLYESNGNIEVLSEGSLVVDNIIERIRELYPQAYDALCECYAKSRINAMHFNFLVARRFCKCNLGNLDHTKHDVDNGNLNFERVPCPLLGECKYEGVVCMPKMNSRLSEAEKRVMKLVCDGLSNQEIAEKLYLSTNTVKRHITNAYMKTNLRNRTEFVKFANDNSLF